MAQFLRDMQNFQILDVDMWNWFQGDPEFVPVKFDRVKSESSESISESEDSPGSCDCVFVCVGWLEMASLVMWPS